MMGTVFKFKEPKNGTCKLCGRALTDEWSELAYEVISEDGSAEKVEVGKVCKSCADTLDTIDLEADMAPDDDDI